MKKIAFLLLVALLSTTTITAQKTVISKNQSKERVFDVVENMPEFPGGQDSLMSFLMHTIKYPKEAMEKGIQGRVVAKFIVEKDGQVSTPKVVRSVYPAACDSLYAEMEAWQAEWKRSTRIFHPSRHFPNEINSCRRPFPS